ncbi:MAG: FAD-dependent oxidoreductase [Candidatus Omnitrophica bacterium]|nr:FAD-dependent oxidoreductase [Candidatus Omnitrophota bacterium]
MYDLIIIGAGPAGITAAVYAARKKMQFLVLTQDIGGQAAWSADVENYTGYQLITGADLARRFEEHMRQYAIAVHEQEPVESVVAEGYRIVVRTARAAYETRTVIIASGKRSRELGVPGEKEFRNRGLTYCATCDGPLFAKKDVAVIGGGNSALDAALQLVRFCSRVYVINDAPRLGGDEIAQDKLLEAKNAQVFNNARVTGIEGDKFVKAVTMRQEGARRRLDVQGVFVEIGLLPNSGFAKEVGKNESGEIIVDCSNTTSVPGVFAAGDVTTVPEKQIIIAAGEGAKACLTAFRYLNQHRF